jgi:hypothetical protein
VVVDGAIHIGVVEILSIYIIFHVNMTDGYYV